MGERRSNTVWTFVNGRIRKIRIIKRNKLGGQKMKIEDARKIIQEESLQGYNLCEERENRENEVVLKKENEKCCYTQCAFNITNLKIDVIM